MCVGHGVCTLVDTPTVQQGTMHGNRCLPYSRVYHYTKLGNAWVYPMHINLTPEVGSSLYLLSAVRAGAGFRSAEKL